MNGHPHPLLHMVGVTMAAALTLATAIPGAQAQQQKAPTEADLKAKGARQKTGAEARASRVGNTWYFLRLADGGVLNVFYPDERNKRAAIG